MCLQVENQLLDAWIWEHILRQEWLCLVFNFVINGGQEYEEDIEEYDLNPINRMYVEVSVLDDLGPHHYGEEIVKNRSVKVEYGE
mgnify:CR=1 FL=1